VSACASDASNTRNGSSRRIKDIRTGRWFDPNQFDIGVQKNHAYKKPTLTMHKVDGEKQAKKTGVINTEPFKKFSSTVELFIGSN